MHCGDSSHVTQAELMLPSIGAILFAPSPPPRAQWRGAKHTVRGTHCCPHRVTAAIERRGEGVWACKCPEAAGTFSKPGSGLASLCLAQESSALREAYDLHLSTGDSSTYPSQPFPVYNPSHLLSLAVGISRHPSRLPGALLG